VAITDPQIVLMTMRKEGAGARTVNHYLSGARVIEMRRDAEGFTFRFLGGPPGWQVEGVAATVETELTISLDGTSLVRVVYNGVPRQR
jgi:hypothetical protein